MTSPIKFSCAGWEDGAEIRFNQELSLTYGNTSCVHCSEKEYRTHKRSDMSEYTEAFCFCPRLLIAWNEGGCSTTGVCLDCVLDQVKKINEP